MPGISHEVERQEFQFESVAQHHRRSVFARIGLQKVSRHDADRNALRVVALDDRSGAAYGREPVDGLQGLVAAFGIAAHAVDDRRDAGGFVRHRNERRLGHRAVLVRRLPRLVPELEPADVVRDRSERLLQFVREHAAHLREHPDALDGREPFARGARLLFHAVALPERGLQRLRSHAYEVIRADHVKAEEGENAEKTKKPIEVTPEKAEEGLLVEIGEGAVVQRLHEGAHAAQVHADPPTVVLLRRHSEENGREPPDRIVLCVGGVGDRPVRVARRRREADALAARFREDGPEGLGVDHSQLAQTLVGTGGKKPRVGVARGDRVEHFRRVVRAPEKGAEEVVGVVSLLSEASSQPLPGSEGDAALQGEALAAQILPVLGLRIFRRDDEKRARHARSAFARPFAGRKRHRAGFEHEGYGRARRRDGEGNAALAHFLYEYARRNPLDVYAPVGKGALERLQNRQNALVKDRGRARILNGDPEIAFRGTARRDRVDRKKGGGAVFAVFERTKGGEIEACRRDGVGRRRFFGGKCRRKKCAQREGE